MQSKWAYCFIVLSLMGCSKPPTAPVAGGKPVGHWMEVLKDPSAVQRKIAVTKLGNVGAADAAVYPAIVGALNDADGSVRCEAILALLKFGKAAADARPRLEEMEKVDPVAKVRRYANKALEKIGGGF